jgi:O-antigen ligase
MTGGAAAWIARWPQVAAAGLGLMALTSVWKTAPAHVGAAIGLVGALLFWLSGGRPRWDAVDRVVALLLAWLVVRFALQLAGVAEPALVEPRRGFADWVWPLAFAPLAVDSTRATKRVQQLWVLSMVGFAAGTVGYFVSNGFEPLLRGDRLGFHLDRPLGVGLYAGAFLLALLSTSPTWWRAGGRWRWAVRALAGLFVVLCLVVLLGSQNRSTWLGLLVVGVASLGAAGFRSLDDAARRRRILPLAVVGVALAVGIGWLAVKSMEFRTNAEREAVATVLEQGLGAAPATNITIRLRLWQFVADRFGEAPWLGHGFGGVQDALRAQLRGGAPLLEGEVQDHVHSTYLQTLYGQGLIGCTLWALLGVFLLRDLVRSARHNPDVASSLPAVWSVLAFTAVWALTDYRLSHPDMRFFSILLLLSLRLLGCAQPPARSAR